MTTHWLSLSEYSKKYDVSISTLRRRIKQKACDFIFDEGRYELRDCPLEEHEGIKAEKPKDKKVMDLSAPPQTLTGSKSSSSHSQVHPTHLSVVPSPAADSSQLLTELKKAYSMILNEKEQQILTLKEEVADLRTLVRVLEESNQQLKASLEEARSIDSWLSSLDK